MKCERCLEWVTIKPESREPQAAADSFDENWDGQLPLELEKLIEDSLKDHKPNGPLNVACGAARLALRYAHSQGVARMQGEIANWKQLHDNNEACINNQHDRISALERERDELLKKNDKLSTDLVNREAVVGELKEACEKISKTTYEFNPWTVVPTESAKIASEALKRIGGGK